ncbi:hypothetical protein C1646_767571 [Rhizophagus diaphanus]|nr:hypothetical protein C1646_767571 [Rhizophagus diaphanus] [Rhizophagus sp. MUCL 43196]
MSPMIYTISSVYISNIERLLFPFLHDCSFAIKSNIWKNFRHNNQQTSSDEFMPRRELRRETTREYVNPHFDFRNYKNHTDLLFILFSSSFTQIPGLIVSFVAIFIGRGRESEGLFASENLVSY